MGLQSRLAWLLLLLLLLLLSHCPFSEQQSPEGEGEVRVKLCGRDFARAVVFTCGGSRFRRISPKTTPPTSPQIDFLQITSDKGQENNNLLSVLDPTVAQLQSLSQPAGQPSLKDLFTLYDNYIGSVPPSDHFLEYIRQAEVAARKRGAETEPNNLKSLNNFPWVKYPRRKRDPVTMLSEICCALGCNQSLLSRLC